MSEQGLPHSFSAEQSALGAAMIEETAVIELLNKLPVNALYRSNHRVICEVIAAVHEAGMPVDIITVAEELRRRGRLEEVGGMAYLTALQEACPSARNMAAYIEPIKETYAQRQLLSAANKITVAVKGQEYEIDELLEYCEQLVSQVSKEQLSATSHRLCDLVDDQQKRVLKAAESPQGAKGTMTGFTGLDRLTNSFKPGQLITLAGCSAMGKSALASQIAFNALKATKKPVIVFSLEMSKEQWIDRMVASEARVNGHNMRNGQMEDMQWRQMMHVQKTIRELPMFIIDTPALTSREIKAQTRSLIAQHGEPALIVIDYLQIAEHAEKQKDERLRVTQLVRDFKNLARHTKTPVLCLSQLSRGVNTRENKRPVLSDLRETSAIEAESDVVLFVYRPSYYQAKRVDNDGSPQWQGDNDTAEMDEIIVAKQREGDTGIVPVRFINEYARFENPEYRWQ